MYKFKNSKEKNVGTNGGIDGLDSKQLAYNVFIEYYLRCVIKFANAYCLRVKSETFSQIPCS